MGVTDKSKYSPLPSATRNTSSAVRLSLLRIDFCHVGILLEDLLQLLRADADCLSPDGNRPALFLLCFFSVSFLFLLFFYVF